MKVALGQIDCEPGRIEANTRKLCDHVYQAAKKGCGVVIFPELADTGYDPTILASVSVAWQAGPLPVLQTAAAEAGIFVVCGLSERVEGGIYNALAVISPSGKLIGRYRKAHLITPSPFFEDRSFSPGCDLLLSKIGEWRWGFTICYDIRFPELFRVLALAGAKALVNCAAFPDSRAMNWDVLTRARAIENQTYLLAVNRVGTDGPCRFGGLSRVVAPDGTLVAEASADTEELLIASLDLQKIDIVRNEIPVFDARRPDIYGDLSAPGNA